MKNKINIAKLLCNCPKGMELDCTMFDNVTFEEVVTEIDCDGHEDITIVLLTHYKDGMVDEIILTEYGTYTYDETAKCVIFPKGKTTWEGFTPPLKLKVGYKIKCIKTGSIYEIIKIVPNYYIANYLGSDIMISWNDHDKYEIVSNKFDISKLKPFDKVLVRSDNKHRWSIQFFERSNNVLKDSFVCMGGWRYNQCIPYEGNEHLLNTANECEDYFKTWQK